MPHPDGPRREKNSPLLTVSETSFTAVSAPKRFVTWSNTRKSPAIVPNEFPFCPMVTQSVDEQHLPILGERPLAVVHESLQAVDRTTQVGH